MFLVGGVLADRFGARRTILAGCAVRVLASPRSPCHCSRRPRSSPSSSGGPCSRVSAALSSRRGSTSSWRMPSTPRPRGVRSRASLFAWWSVAGEFGACSARCWVPLCSGGVRGGGSGRGRPVRADRRVPRPRSAASDPAAAERGHTTDLVVAPRPTVRGLFALHAADLLAFNQLYLALPLQLARADDAGPGGGSRRCSRGSRRSLARAAVAGVALVPPRGARPVLCGRGTGSRPPDSSWSPASVVVPLDASGRVVAVFVAAGSSSSVTDHQSHGGRDSSHGSPRCCRPDRSSVCSRRAARGRAPRNVAVGALLGWTTVPAAAWLLLAVPLVVAAVWAPPSRPPRGGRQATRTRRVDSEGGYFLVNVSAMTAWTTTIVSTTSSIRYSTR